MQRPGSGISALKQRNALTVSSALVSGDIWYKHKLFLSAVIVTQQNSPNLRPHGHKTQLVCSCTSFPHMWCVKEGFLVCCDIQKQVPVPISSLQTGLSRPGSVPATAAYAGAHVWELASLLLHPTVGWRRLCIHVSVCLDVLSSVAKAQSVLQSAYFHLVTCPGPSSEYLCWAGLF